LTLHGYRVYVVQKYGKSWGRPLETPRGLASVREKRWSRHASQALLFFLCVATYTVYISASVYSGSATGPPFSLRYSPVAAYNCRKFPAPRQEVLWAQSLFTGFARLCRS
jgi:hypothetical protein